MHTTEMMSQNAVIKDEVLPYKNKRCFLSSNEYDIKIFTVIIREKMQVNISPKQK